jgi:phosphatidate cytidylyltransferase
MLKTRVITAVALLVLIVGILAWGGSAGWGAFVLLVIGLGLWEWGRFAGLEESARVIYAVAGSAVLLGVSLFGALLPIAPLLFTASALFWIGLVPKVLRDVGASWFNARPLHLGLAFILLSAAGTAMIVARDRGIVFLFSLLALVWVADVGAYFVGKSIGRRKLAPRISPGKSWEGAVGGAVLTVAYGWGCVLLAPRYPDLAGSWAALLHAKWHPVLFTGWMAVFAALSVCGDLFESLLKRRIGLKDSSNLLPGHGGVLDRIDAQLPVLPLAVLVLGSA